MDIFSKVGGKLPEKQDYFLHHLPRNGSSLGHRLGTQKVLSWWINASSNGYHESKVRNAYDVTFRRLHHEVKIPASKNTNLNLPFAGSCHTPVLLFCFVSVLFFAKADHKSCLNVHLQWDTRPWLGERTFSPGCGEMKLQRQVETKPYWKPWQELAVPPAISS